MTWLFKNRPPGPARNRIHAAISESWPVRLAGFDMLILSSDFWLSLDSPAVISLGKMPGAMVLTRILVSTRVVANIRPRWRKPALEQAYANWPEEDPFMTPEMLAMFTIDEV